MTNVISLARPRVAPTVQPSAQNQDPTAHQAAIENALSMALYHVRGDACGSLRAATAKANRALSLLKLLPCGRADTMSSTTPEYLRNAIEEMDDLAQGGFTEIATMAKLALLAMEQPNAYTNGGMDHVATMLSAICGKALEIENCINLTAENVGCNYVDQAALRRSKAAEEHRKSMTG